MYLIFTGLGTKLYMDDHNYVAYVSVCACITMYIKIDAVCNNGLIKRFSLTFDTRPISISLKRKCTNTHTYNANINTYLPKWILNY